MAPTAPVLSPALWEPTVVHSFIPSFMHSFLHKHVLSACCELGSGHHVSEVGSPALGGTEPAHSLGHPDSLLPPAEPASPLLPPERGVLGPLLSLTLRTSISQEISTQGLSRQLSSRDPEAGVGTGRSGPERSDLLGLVPSEPGGR